MKLFDGNEFWQNLSDELDRRGLNNMKLAEKAGLAYRTITTQRNRHTIPGAEQLYRMSVALGVTMEFLLTGQDTDIATPPRIMRIIEKCRSASDEDLALVERVLRLEPDEKKSERGGALA